MQAKGYRFKSDILHEDGSIAQLVEQGTENPCVGGSIPPGPTKKMITDKEFQELEKMAKLKFEEEEKKKIMIELNKIIDKLKILSREK